MTLPSSFSIRDNPRLKNKKGGISQFPLFLFLVKSPLASSNVSLLSLNVMGIIHINQLKFTYSLNFYHEQFTQVNVKKNTQIKKYFM
jgi:hypothetical protein